jgi:hypothetical protein
LTRSERIGGSKRRYDRLHSLAIDRAPAIAQKLERVGAVAQRLRIVDAEDDHDEVDVILAGRQIARRLRPVVIIVAHQAGGFVRLVGDRDFRLVGESLGQAAGRENAQTVADDIDEEGRLNRRPSGRSRLARCRRRHEIAHARFVRAMRRGVRRFRLRSAEQMRKEVAEPAAFGANRRSAQRDAKDRHGDEARQMRDQPTINRELHLAPSRAAAPRPRSCRNSAGVG